jgi:GNAT superfamily N-acetyltransferase
MKIADESITLRPVGAEDEAFLLELYKSSRGDDLRGLGWNENRISEFLEMQYQAQRVFFASDYPNLTDQIILLNGNAIGRMAVYSTTGETRLVDLALIPEQRNKDLGTQLIQAVQEEARAAGRPLRLQVIRFSRAVNLFERLGFARTSETGTHFQMEWNAS